MVQAPVLVPVDASDDISPGASVHVDAVVDSAAISEINTPAS